MLAHWASKANLVKNVEKYLLRRCFLITSFNFTICILMDISLLVSCVLMKLTTTLVRNESKLVGVTGDRRGWLDSVQIHYCRVTPGKNILMLGCWYVVLNWALDTSEHPTHGSTSLISLTPEPQITTSGHGPNISTLEMMTVGQWSANQRWDRAEVDSNPTNKGTEWQDPWWLRLWRVEWSRCEVWGWVHYTNGTVDLLVITVPWYMT